MSLSQARLEVLESLFLKDKPIKTAALANEAGKEAKATQMHLIGLVKAGYALSPMKGEYAITEKGKEALGVPETNKKRALEILEQVPQEKAFHFYAELGKPLNIYAMSLQQFCDKLNQIQAESVEFHLKRGDFENWFKLLGDFELALKVALLKKRKMTAEELRAKLRGLGEERCITLAAIASEPNANP